MRSYGVANDTKAALLQELNLRYGSLRKLANSESLYSLRDDTVRIYVRYSKLHGGNRAFYGLRQEDTRQLEGHSSLICFLWDHQLEPLFIPFADYEELLQTMRPASDGQYKVHVHLGEGGVELNIGQAGWFNVEANLGWGEIEDILTPAVQPDVSDLSHSQVQTLLAAIGATKGYDIWVPPADRSRLDRSVANTLGCRDVLPYGFDAVRDTLQEVDVIWIQRGSSDLTALFEVEHSTTIYSALLRFNDIHLVAPLLHPRFSVVANDVRRSAFVRQLSRPTFGVSGLSKVCTFINYGNVLGWYHRTIPTQSAHKGD